MEEQWDIKLDLNQLRTEPWIPNQDKRRVIRMLWSLVSAARERSRRWRHRLHSVLKSVAIKWSVWLRVRAFIVMLCSLFSRARHWPLVGWLIAFSDRRHTIAEMRSWICYVALFTDAQVILRPVIVGQTLCWLMTGESSVVCAGVVLAACGAFLWAAVVHVVGFICHWIFRPHHGTMYIDVACCYRWSSVVCLSVCHDCEPCKSCWTDRHVVWGVDLVGPLDGVAHQCNLANTTGSSLCSSDAAFLSNYFDHLL